MTNGTRRGPQDPDLGEAGANFKRLEAEKLVAFNTLHPEVVRRINALAADDVEALIRVHKGVGTLAVFFDGIVPQL